MQGQVPVLVMDWILLKIMLKVRCIKVMDLLILSCELDAYLCHKCGWAYCPATNWLLNSKLLLGLRPNNNWLLNSKLARNPVTRIPDFLLPWLRIHPPHLAQIIIVLNLAQIP